MRTLFEKNMELDMDGVQASLFDKNIPPTSIEYGDAIPNPVDLMHIHPDEADFTAMLPGSVLVQLDPVRHITPDGSRVEMLDIYRDGAILLHCKKRGATRVFYVTNDMKTIAGTMKDYPTQYTYLQRDILVPKWMTGKARRVYQSYQRGA